MDKFLNPTGMHTSTLKWGMHFFYTVQIFVSTYWVFWTWGHNLVTTYSWGPLGGFYMQSNFVLKLIEYVNGNMFNCVQNLKATRLQ